MANVLVENWQELGLARSRTDSDAHDADNGGPPAVHVRTTIVDGRGLGLRTLKRHGLQLISQRTLLSAAAFYEEGGEIHSDYHPEMVEAI